MNFENLYSRVFLKEAEEQERTDISPEDINSVPTPDGYEVEPAPIPRMSSSSVAGLESHISKLQEFLESLNGTTSNSLQRFVVQAEGQNSVLKGIANETADDITKIAGSIATLVQTLKGFVSVADLRKKEIAMSVTGKI